MDHQRALFWSPGFVAPWNLHHISRHAWDRSVFSSWWCVRRCLVGRQMQYSFGPRICSDPLVHFTRSPKKNYKNKVWWCCSGVLAQCLIFRVRGDFCLLRYSGMDRFIGFIHLQQSDRQSTGDICPWKPCKSQSPVGGHRSCQPACIATHEVAKGEEVQGPATHLCTQRYVYKGMFSLARWSFAGSRHEPPARHCPMVDSLLALKLCNR